MAVSMPSPPPYVAVADPTRWVVEHGSGLGWKLRRLGFHRWLPGLPFEAKFRRPLPFDRMGILAARLRDLGLAFSAGPDWSPSEVMQFLRDEGHIAGTFMEIAWVDGGVWKLREL
jgi:hypothetical protein